MSSVPLHLQQRLVEKQQELEQLRILNQFAGHLMSHFDELSEKFDALAQGNLAVSKVVGNWTSVFKTIELTDNYVASQNQENGQEKSSLVRLPTA
ncbi:hypothetical protein BG005_003487 [Podila minutissima]|nr:hypothetical protein BG005_003487 [Podila minutissima]